MLINRNQIIHCEIYHGFCDYTYCQQDNLPSGVVHCELGAIPEFFQRIKGTKNQYILVSSKSDFGLCYQKDFPPWLDLEKACGIFQRPEHSYKGIIIPKRVSENCRPEDKYSIKCYSYTHATFNEIPPNIRHWFLTNCMINDPRLTAIPFGINCCKGDFTAIDLIEKVEVNKTKPLYVNFTFNTKERLELYNYYRSCKFATVKSKIGGLEYTQDLADHSFILCPNGNGVDCYRTWEAIYLGAIPIIQAHLGTLPLLKYNLPIIPAMSMFFNYITIENLHRMVQKEKFNLEAATADFWKKKIEEKRSLLCGSSMC